jgi:hypothetical protein
MMYSTYIIYNIVPWGFLFLLVYIFLDIFLDFFRKETRSNLRRVLLYSFLFYLMSLLQIKFGGITLPPQNPADLNSGFISTNDWFGIYDTMYVKVSMWWPSSVFYNVLLLIPLGIYLSVLFNLNSLKRVTSIVISSCIGIGVSQLLLESLGLIIKSSNRTDIIYLLFNILGGILGFLLVKLTIKIINSSKNKMEAEA